MKNKQYLIIFFLVLANLVCAQQFENKQFIDKCIKEVYQDQADAMVFKHSSERYNIYKTFLKHISVEYHPELADKKITSTDDLDLNNEYNSNLKYDKSYNANTFNPIKYLFPFITYNQKVFRIAQTDYLIIISPTTNR